MEPDKVRERRKPRAHASNCVRYRPAMARRPSARIAQCGALAPAIVGTFEVLPIGRCVAFFYQNDCHEPFIPVLGDDVELDWTRLARHVVAYGTYSSQQHRGNGVGSRVYSLTTATR